MQFLLSVTLIVNFLALVVALWLGLYVVTRSPRSQIAWLTGLMLWWMAGLFLEVLLALNPPPVPIYFPGWLQGWLMTPAAVLWHHVTVLMRPERLNPWRWTRILVGYGLAVAALFVQLKGELILTLSGNLLYLSDLQAGPLYPFFAACGLLYIGMSLVNLLRSARAAPAVMLRKQLVILAMATLVGGLSGPLAVVGSGFGLPVPTIARSLLIGGAVVLIGYGMARYSALVDGRTIRRDFIYNATAVGLAAALYLAVMWGLVWIYEEPRVGFALVVVVMLAIVTHSLADVAYRTLDSVLFSRETRQVRANLRRLTALAGERNGWDEGLSLAFDSLCTSVRATFGLAILFEDDRPQPVVAYRGPRTGLPLSVADLVADDIRPLAPGEFPPPLAEAALLIPLYVETRQLGALILGRPVNGLNYSQADLELLLDSSDRLADAIRDAQRETAHLAQVARLVEASHRKANERAKAAKISIKAVENALRNLANYAYLGEHPLTRLKLVRSQLPEEAVTHLDRGKVVHHVLADTIEKLRPEDEKPGEPPPRAWHPYLILHEAYLQDVPNRDIMSYLYISEGTFNRTRRAALRAVTRSLEELETALI